MTQNNALAPHERDDFEVAYAAEYQATLGATCAARDIADMREGDRYPTDLHYLNGQWKGWQARAALAAQRAADGIEAPTAVGALILGGAVSSTELGDNDISLDGQVVERIQRELVKDSEDLAVELMLVGQHYRILQALRAERDVALAAIAQLHSMLGVTDQVQAGNRIGLLVGQSIMVPKLEARLAALEKQEPLAWVDTDWIAQVSDPRGAGCTVRRAYGSAGADLTPVYPSPVAQAGQVPDEFAFEYRHPNGERHTVWVSREQVLEQMPDFIFEALCDKFCNCQPVGETNVVECNCDEYAEEFQLVATAPAQGGE